MILNGDRHELGLYIREVADLMGLCHWTVGVANDPPRSSDANAQVDVPFGRHAAMIRFPATWATRGPEELRQTIVHELVHAHLWSMDQRMCDLHSILSKREYKIAYKAFHETLELAVDGIAQAWAERLPLPIRGGDETST